MELLPHAFLFRFAVPVCYAVGRPKRGRWPVGDEGEPLPLFSALDSSSRNVGLPDVTLRVVWNEDGLGISAMVSGIEERPVARTDAASDGDGLHLWIDTRNTQGAHRASRFCHRFALLPAVGRGKSAAPAVRQIPIGRAREDAPLVDVSNVSLAADVANTGYRVEAWFPAETLHGFDPENSPRLGFHAVVKNARQGDRSLTVGDAFPIDHDPSLWTTLDLVREQ